MKTYNSRYNAIKIVLILILPFLMAGALYGQPSVNIGQHVRCQNSVVLIPVEVTDFDDIVAITLQITLDTLKTEFISLENIHAGLSGGSVIYNFVASSSSLFITWQSLTAANIGSDTLFDVKLDYFEGDAEINFGAVCEIVLSDLTIVEAILVDGIIYPALQITEHPQPITVTEGDQAQFTAGVNYPATHTFAWQQHDGNSWTALSNNAFYTGVASPILTIDSVPLAFNHYAYRCLISLDDCSVVTDSAQLTVSPLMVIDQDDGERKKILAVYPNPCRGNVSFAISESGKNLGLRLTSSSGQLVWQQSAPKSQGTVSLTDVVPGLYFMQLLRQGQPIETIGVVVN